MNVIDPQRRRIERETFPRRYPAISRVFDRRSVSTGTVYRVVQDTSTVAEVAHLEDSAQKMLGQGDHLCVLTTSATIAVFADRNADAETLQTVNTVRPPIWHLIL